jgi:hypothetical protein
MPTPDAIPKNWLAILGKIEPLHPRYVIPDHGELGNASLIEQVRPFLMDLEKRALELKRQGKWVELAPGSTNRRPGRPHDAGKQLTAELEMKYPDWGNFIGIPNAVRRVYEESQ